MYAVLHFAQTVSVAAQHHQHGASAGAIKAPTRGVLCGVGADKEPEACRAPAAGSKCNNRQVSQATTWEWLPAISSKQEPTGLVRRII